MPLHGPVLIATDLSDADDEAVRQGVALADDLAAPAVIAHVLPEAFRLRVLFPHTAGVDARVQGELADKAAAAVRQRVETVLGARGRDLEIALDTGSPHAGILAMAAARQAGVIVLAAGSTAVRVARGAGVPVLVARTSPRGGVIIAATDFSDPALPAVRTAAAQAATRKVRLRILHCLDIDAAAYAPAAAAAGIMHIAPVSQETLTLLEQDAREHLQRAIATAAPEAEGALIRRPPAQGILDAAAEAATSLIVVGTRGRTGIVRFALGSVAEDVVNHAPCSVLVVPLAPAQPS